MIGLTPDITHATVPQFFFFEQKTAYEVMPRLVGSEMCIRDSPLGVLGAARGRQPRLRQRYPRRERQPRVAGVAAEVGLDPRRQLNAPVPRPDQEQVVAPGEDGVDAVSYTHLTLPTIYSV